MNTWIRVEVDILKHYKTRNLKRLLGIPTMREAASYPIALWAFAVQHAWRDGDLSLHGADGIEEACEWRGKPGALVEAMQKCGKDGGHGFLHKDALVAHEFTDRISRLVKDRIYRENKKQVETPAPTTAKKSSTQVGGTILSQWNAFAKKHDLPLSTGFKSESIDINMFSEALKKSAAQPFLLGQGPKGWKMDLRWLLRDDNMAKVVAGGYGAGEEKGEHRPTPDEQNARNEQVLRARGLL